MQAILIAVLELALKHGVPAIIEAVRRCEGDVTPQKIADLAELVQHPESYEGRV